MHTLNSRLRVVRRFVKEAAQCRKQAKLIASLGGPVSSVAALNLRADVLDNNSRWAAFKLVSFCKKYDCPLPNTTKRLKSLLEAATEADTWIDE